MLTHTRLREVVKLCVVVRDVKSLPPLAAVERQTYNKEISSCGTYFLKQC